MTDLILDTFDGAGSLAGRVPNTGVAWASSAVGVVGSGVLRSVTTPYATYFSGRVDCAPFGDILATCDALTVKLDYSTTSTIPFLGQVDIRSNSNYGTSVYGRLLGFDFISGFRLRALGEFVAVDGWNPWGTHEVVLTLDFLSNEYTVYLDGAVYRQAAIPASEDYYRPTPADGCAVLLDFSGDGGGTNPLQMSSLLLTDSLYTPVVAPFWTRRVKCVETP